MFFLVLIIVLGFWAVTWFLSGIAVVHDEASRFEKVLAGLWLGAGLYLLFACIYILFTVGV